MEEEQVERDLQLVIITGLSGAGKTVAVQSLEDLGYFCVDNLPPALIPKFAELMRQSEGKVSRLALVCDIRGGSWFSHLLMALKDLGERYGVQYRILFLEARDEVLVRRYKATRRRHPLAQGNRILEGIEKERTLLEEIRDRADWIIDTSLLKPAELKEKIAAHFSGSDINRLTLHLVSFGFKYGVPIDADLVFDVRFLPNPYYLDALRPLTGLDLDVYEYVMKWPAAKTFSDKLTDMLDFLLPQYVKEGRSQLVVAVGCTGGQHRSVAMVELLRRHYQAREKVHVYHRDIHRDLAKGADVDG
ncbi:RNase adapter RapZ [Kyrpidia tusciae]|uniref:RNase adapter RapZ n=1 Tax=Kyrpidia tusciae TaxID=33943 RepID=UPI0002DE1567|nr:RNase adapter RapZ [Kyrpidia tusciae]